MSGFIKRCDMADLAWLADPNVFAVNRIKAHSDHRYYVDGKEPRQYINGTWKFTYSENPVEREKDFYNKEYDISKLDDITVPGHIQLQGYGEIKYVNLMYPWDALEDIIPPQVPENGNPVGGYVKDVVIDKELLGKRIFISFQGVETAFYLYVNDKFVGYSEDSFTPSEFEITKYVCAGKNRIGVEVHQRSTGAWLEDQDFWRFSGIFRDVYLYAIPDIHVRDMFVHTRLDNEYKNCSISIDADIMVSGGCSLCRSDCSEGECSNVARESNRKKVEDARVDIVITDPSGKIVIDDKDMTIANAFDKEYIITDAMLWSAECPNLYTLEIRILQNGIETEKIVQKTGIRKIEIKDRIMLINGKRIEFNGVNRHEFNCKTGRCISEEDMLWDVKFCKSHNINAVRTSHYPNNSRWYELCDEYGIYLIDEANLETHGSWCMENPPMPIPEDHPEWCGIVLDRANSMIQRDKNHPSVLIWSCGNESSGGINIFKMSQLMRNYDDSRIIHYEGVFFDRRYNDTSDIESRMYAKPWDIEEYLKGNPSKPYISCEYSHAMGNSCGNISEYQELLDKYDMYQGGFIWDYIDQFIVRENRYGEVMAMYGGDFGDRPNDSNFCGDGIIFCDRKKTPKIQEIKYVYQQICLFPDFGGVKIKNRRLFKSADDLALRIQMLKDGKVCYETEFDIDVKPQEEKYYPVSIPETLNRGEYVIQAYAFLKEATAYADAGYEIARGRSEVRKVFDNKESDKNSNLKEIKVIKGHSNIGVHGEGFSALFSKSEGSLISLKYNGEEYIERKPMPCYYRASTDNDRGCSYMFKSGIWQYAGKWQRMKSVDVIENERSVDIIYVYQLPAFESGEVKVIYTVKGDGTVTVDASYPGIEGAPELPLFGMEFVLRRDQDRFVYYGLGPDENYTDRNKGAMYGIYADSATENLTKYVFPTACGNRTQVRWVEVGNDLGMIRFESVDKPFQCTVLHYNETQLEEARHMEELPKPCYTYVKIMADQMGVGGDDSWGALVHEQYRMPGNSAYRLKFTLSQGKNSEMRI